MFKILIVEDDKELSLLFQKVLEKSGYQVKSASDGAQALEVLDREYIDLIISDIMMPVMDGYELVSELRSAGYQIPVLMITAKSSFDDMRQGFLSGSDDYMVKPVNVNEMVLRVGALLRRAQILNEHKIVIGSTELDYDAMTVVTGDETLVLPKKEFLLVYKLAASPGRTFTKQQLMDEVWGYETEADPHTIEVHIGRIRERFKDNPDFEIVTMRGIGYKIHLQHLCCTKLFCHDIKALIGFSNLGYATVCFQMLFKISLGNCFHCFTEPGNRLQQPCIDK